MIYFKDHIMIIQIVLDFHIKLVWNYDSLGKGILQPLKPFRLSQNVALPLLECWDRDLGVSNLFAFAKALQSCDCYLQYSLPTFLQRLSESRQRMLQAAATY